MAADLGEWKQGVEVLRGRLANIPGVLSPEGLAARLEDAFRVKSGWTTEQDVYACGQLEPEILVSACRAGLLMWWVPMAAMTYFGNLEGLRVVHDAMEKDPGKGTNKPDLSTTLTWGCWNYSIIEGAPPVMNPDVVNQLLDWGAKPDVGEHNQGTFFEKALRTSNAGVIRAFLAHGAPVELARNVIREFINAGNYQQAAQIQDAFGIGGFYTKVDDRTVMETKYISEATGDSVLRTIFNFSARRVNEVFEFAHGGGAMNSCSFEDYDQKTLHVVREKLEKLGGRTDDAPCALDKPKRPRL
ncbi:MAG: hypothetical protein EPN97_15270 [Alphaproteobacteria bacterium]|nr:MAG: hypothetical protein EPN97_15270 [Alphaproteobacteria bacterium]